MEDGEDRANRGEHDLKIGEVIDVSMLYAVEDGEDRPNRR